MNNSKKISIITDKQQSKIINIDKKILVDIDCIDKKNISEVENFNSKLDAVLYEVDTLNQGIISQIQQKISTASPKIIADLSKDETVQENKVFDSFTSTKTEVVNSKNAPFYLKPLTEIIDDGDYLAYRERIRLLGDSFLYPDRQKSILLEEGLKIPECVWSHLLDFQKESLKWLWKLHKEEVGGILSDEMGLGKTVQIIAFLSALHFTGIGRKNSNSKGLGSVLIALPATILKTWLTEFFNWWPYLRVSIFHHTGVYRGSIRRFIQNITSVDGSVLLTTYSSLLLYQKHFIDIEWDYVILDEGHKIKNPDSNIAQLVNHLRTPHRIIVSGTPIQNNLKELWSLVNFAYPGLLGTLPIFIKDVAMPITRAGYTNSSLLQIKTGYKCAKMLKNVIEPYLLRRTKKQVQVDINLPKKSDYVLFCRLTKQQSALYSWMISNTCIRDIINGESAQFLTGLTMLRKICNHPSLIKVDEKNKSIIDQLFKKIDKLSWKMSTKMIVLNSLLKDWSLTKHKVLIYSQSTKMLNLIESYCCESNFSYLRLDGKCPVSQRQPLVDKFNNDISIFLFLLTTKVGGVGISLVGADRVVVYDPDWNPSTDTQAKERAWRIGQKKEVIVYRLLTVGTVEEKIYNRQVFKQYLATKILENPAQCRVKLDFSDIHELFFYDENNNTSKKDSAVTSKTSITLNTPIVSTHIDRVEQNRNQDNIEVSKKRRYKWRQETDSSEDDTITPILIQKSKIIKKIKSDELQDSSSITDIALIDAEADRLAKEAIEKMKNSHRVNTSKDVIHFSKSESASANKAPSSQSIMSNLLNFNKLEPPTIETISSTGTPDINTTISLLKSFLISQNKQATTKEIVDKFGNLVKCGVDSLAFKNIIKTICDFRLNSKNSGKWHLKDEYL